MPPQTPPHARRSPPNWFRATHLVLSCLVTFPSQYLLDLPGIQSFAQRVEYFQRGLQPLPPLLRLTLCLIQLPGEVERFGLGVGSSHSSAERQRFLQRGFRLGPAPLPAQEQ